MSAPAPETPAPAPENPAAPAPETADEKWKRRGFYLSLVSTILLLVGGAASVVQHFLQQEKIAADQLKQQRDEAKARKEAAEKEGDLRRRELALMIYREKKEAYGLLVDAATDIATAKDRAEVEAKVGKFYAVYYGRIHIIPELDPPVQKAKNAFEERLREYLADKSNARKPLDVFSSPLNDIATVCQRGLDCHKLFEKQDPNSQSQPAESISIPALFGLPGSPSGGQGPSSTP